MRIMIPTSGTFFAKKKDDTVNYVCFKFKSDLLMNEYIFFCTGIDIANHKHYFLDEQDSRKKFILGMEVSPVDCLPCFDVFNLIIKKHHKNETDRLIISEEYISQLKKERDSN